MRKTRSTAAAGVAALLLSAMAVLGLADPAAAHDELVSSYPEADASLTKSPDEITLEFSGSLTDTDGATVVEIIDEQGANVAIDPVDVSTTFITQHVAPDANTGVFTVRWEAVSSDGHPISGEYAYAVSEETAAAPTAATSPTPAPTESTAQPTPQQSEPEPKSPQGYGGVASGGGDFPPSLYVLIPVVILGCGVIGVVMAGRSRRRRDREDAANADDDA